MITTSKYIALFHTTRSVIKADALCRERGIQVSVIPLPERFSSECGMTLLVDANDYEHFCSLMNEMQIDTTLYSYE